MNRFVFALACAALFVPARVVTESPAAGPDDATLRGWLTERVANRPDVGLVVGVYAGGHGHVVAAGSGGPTLAQMNGDTVFEIGSATRLFTAAVLADMVARGEIGLEDPIRKFLPAEVRPPTRAGAEIRLVDLATHTSGLHDRFPLAPASPSAKWRLAIDLPAGVLDSCVGSYERAPFDSRALAQGRPGSALVVTREGGALFVRPTGLSKVRAYAETPTAFFLGAIDAQITFLTDADGKVTGMTVHQGGGDTQARRITSSQ